MTRRPTISGLLLAVTAFTAAMSLPAHDVRAQTIRGHLLDLDTGQPIDLGLVMMFTASGDSVAAALTNRSGTFEVTSPEPGSFLLLASAWGYRETSEGVFELGEGGEMTVDFRIRPEPLPLEGILVGVDRPVFDHHLVRNGFVRRMQRGLGHFITPYDIENSPARDTESLLYGIPEVIVQMPRTAGGMPIDYVGEQVLMRSGSGGFCVPSVFVDGIRVFYDPYKDYGRGAAASLSTQVPLQSVEAVEVYRRPAEVPVEYGITQPRVTQPGSTGSGTCGLILFWTKEGPRGGGALASRSSGRVESAHEAAINPRLPPAAGEGPPPSAGERIRMLLDPEAAEALGLTSLWTGTFRTVRAGELVANEASSDMPVAVPLTAVESLQVERERGRARAVRRGVVAGSAFALGTWVGLRFICGPACGKRDQAALPAVLAGTFVGLLVGGQGPGTHWVGAPVPEPEGPAAAAGVGSWGRGALRHR